MGRGVLRSFGEFFGVFARLCVGRFGRVITPCAHEQNPAGFRLLLGAPRFCAAAKSGRGEGEALADGKGTGRGKRRNEDTGGTPVPLGDPVGAAGV